MKFNVGDQVISLENLEAFNSESSSMQGPKWKLETVLKANGQNFSCHPEVDINQVIGMHEHLVGLQESGKTWSHVSKRFFHVVHDAAEITSIVASQCYKDNAKAQSEEQQDLERAEKIISKAKAERVRREAVIQEKLNALLNVLK